MVNKLNIPIIFLQNQENFNNTKNLYKLNNKNLLLKNYNLIKKEFFMFYFSDLFILDKNFIKDCKTNNAKVLKYFDLIKKDFLFVYYLNKIYTYKNLTNFIKFFNFNYSNFYYFLTLNNNNKNIIKLILYLKNKKCLV